MNDIKGYNNKVDIFNELGRGNFFCGITETAMQFGEFRIPERIFYEKYQNSFWNNWKKNISTMQG